MPLCIVQQSFFDISFGLPYVCIGPVPKTIPRARSIEQWLEEREVDVLFGFHEDVVARFEVFMELGRPQTYARVNIYDGAANMLCQRWSQALYHIV